MGIIYYKDQKPTKEQLAEIKTKEDLSKLLGFSVDFFGDYGLDKENGWEIDSENKWLKFKANQVVTQEKMPSQVKFQGKDSDGNTRSNTWNSGYQLPVMEYVSDGIEDTGSKTITPTNDYTVTAISRYIPAEKAYYVIFTFSGSFHKQFAIDFKPISLSILTTYDVKSAGQIITPKTRAIGANKISISVDNFVEDGDLFTWSYTETVFLTMSVSNDTLYNVTINNSSGTLNYNYQAANVMMLPLTEVNLAMNDYETYGWKGEYAPFKNSEFPVVLKPKNEDGSPFAFKEFSETSDKYGVTVESWLINKIATSASNTRYRVGENTFWGTQFDYNVETYSESTDGQYISPNTLVNYWGFKPAIYPIVIFNSDDTIRLEGTSEVVNYQTNSISYNEKVINVEPNDLVLLYERTPTYTITNSAYPDWRIGHNEDSSSPPVTIESWTSSGNFEARYQTYKMLNGRWNVTLSNSGVSSIRGESINKELFNKIIVNSTGSFDLKTLAGYDYSGETEWTGILTGNRWKSFMSIGTYTLNKDECYYQRTSNLSFKAYYNFDMLTTFNATNSIAFADVEAHLTSIETDIFAFGGVTDWEWKCTGANNYLRCNFSALAGLFPTRIPYFKEGYTYTNNKSWSKSSNDYEQEFDCQIGYNRVSVGDVGVLIVLWRNGKLIV